VFGITRKSAKLRYSLYLQVVDMRWGVRDEATDDHMTTELCMREIKNCQRLSMGPNFVVSNIIMIKLTSENYWFQFYFTKDFSTCDPKLIRTLLIQKL
jgi:hypothetical protein